MKKRRRAAEVVWVVNCALAVGALGVFWRTVLAAEAPSWPANPAQPPATPTRVEPGCDAIWEAKLFIEPPAPPPKPDLPHFTYQGMLGDKVVIDADGVTLDEVRVGDYLPLRYDGKPIRLKKVVKDEVVLVIDEEEEIHVPR